MPFAPLRDGFKYGGSSSQINMMTRKAREADKLDEEAEEAGLHSLSGVRLVVTCTP